MTLPLAHGLAPVQDLPIPLWLFYYGGAIVLVFSFVALGVLWRQPRLEGSGPGRELPEWLQRILLSPVTRVVLGAISFGLLVLVFVAAIAGDSAQVDNLAPTFIYVVFWLGVVLLVVLLGNVWPTLNPWKAAADGVAWLWRWAGGSWEPLATYPRRLGCWPAAFSLALFTILELAYWEPANPRALAVAILLYSWLTWVGMAVFGRDVWLRYCDGFSVYFWLLSQIAVFGTTTVRERKRIVLRTPLSGLTRRPVEHGTLAVVAVMLGSVAFDGFSRTPWWTNQVFDLEAPYALDSPNIADLVGFGFNLLGLLTFVLVVALAYLLAVSAARLVTEGPSGLAGLFALSLVPIAFAYAAAHYFSSFVIQGQFAIPLASDPLGRGWDLFGTADFEADLGILSPNVIWYVQVTILVAGHVAGLVLAHDRAVALYKPPVAIRTQYAMLALMVLYTVGGLWLLSQG